MSNAYDINLVQQFKDARTDYARVPAATTGIHNASDRAETFKQTKRQVRKVRQQGKSCLNDVLRASMITVWATFKQKYTSVQLSALFKECMNDGLETLMYAYQAAHNDSSYASGLIF